LRVTWPNGWGPAAPPLADAGTRLAAALRAAEAAPEESAERQAALADASRAITRLWELIGPADGIHGLLSEADRMVRGEAPQAKPFSKELGGE
jgi:hypothetical protein